MKGLLILVLASLIASGCAQITPAQNFNPVSITVNSAPFDVIATPITPVAPYSQAAYQCNVTGDSRYPPFATGTFPLDVAVPVGQRVRVIFANGNLNGATVTQQGEPGVIVQQGGAVVVQQVGGASPIVQPVGSPIVQQSNAPPAALVNQNSPTVVQQPTYPTAPSIPNPPPIVQQPPSTPAPTPTTTPTTPTPTPITTAAPTPTPPSPTRQTPPPASPPPSPIVRPPTNSIQQQPPSTSGTTQPPTSAITLPPTTQASPAGRKLLQDRVAGGPNNGLVEYVALASANSVPGFFAGSTQFGVPYLEFTASEAARGQVASFRGALEVAQVVGGVPQYPFRPNPSLSPECQVNVNFRVA